MQIIKLTILIVMLSLSSCKSTKYSDLDDGLYADVQTDKGDIVLKLEYEKNTYYSIQFCFIGRRE